MSRTMITTQFAKAHSDESETSTLTLDASLAGEDVRALRVEQKDVGTALDEVVQAYAVDVIGEESRGGRNV